MYKRITKIMTSSKWLRFVAASFGVIVLGAIGSGVWDVFLHDVFNSVGDSMLRALTWAFSSFADSMYKSVSRDPISKLSLLPYLALITTIILFPWAFVVILRRTLAQDRKELVDGPKEDDDTDRDQRIEEIDKYRRSGLQWVLPFAFLITLMYASFFYQDTHSIRAAMFVERSIAIVAPQVGQATTVKLTASFRSIENAEDFYALEDELRQIAETHSITLPEFESIR